MSKYETPDYDVVMKEDDFEIRQYADFFIVEYENDQENMSGFQTLFSYISSNNQENEKISMTVPVIQDVLKENKKMAFVVPEKYADQVPQPNNPNLKVKKFKTGLFGVIEYSGFSNPSKELKMTKKLEAWLLENNYKKDLDFMRASYNPPFVPPMFRRNEIWVRVTKENRGEVV